MLIYYAMVVLFIVGGFVNISHSKCIYGRKFIDFDGARVLTRVLTDNDWKISNLTPNVQCEQQSDMSYSCHFKAKKSYIPVWMTKENDEYYFVERTKVNLVFNNSRIDFTVSMSNNLKNKLMTNKTVILNKQSRIACIHLFVNLTVIDTKCLEISEKRIQINSSLILKVIKSSASDITIEGDSNQMDTHLSAISPLNQWKPYLILIIIIVAIVILDVAILLMISLRKRSSTLRNFIKKKILSGETRLPPALFENEIINEEHKILLTDFNRIFETYKENNLKELKKEYKKMVNKSLEAKESQYKVHEAVTQIISNCTSITSSVFQINRMKFKLINSNYCNSKVDAIFLLANQTHSSTSKSETVEYIICQDPMEYGLNDFLEMIIENNVKTVISITKVFRKTSQNNDFWATSCNDDNETEDAKFKMSIFKETQYGNLTERNLFIKDLVTARPDYKLVQLLMKTKSMSNQNTMGFTTPTTTSRMIHENENDVDRFVDHETLINRLHELRTPKIHQGPILVHSRNFNLDQCVVVVCIERIISHLINGGQDVNIFHHMMDISKQRNLTLQQENQYIFVYEFLDYFLKKVTKVVKIKKRTVNRKKSASTYD